jgi:hypothetical protein
MQSGCSGPLKPRPRLVEKGKNTGSPPLAGEKRKKGPFAMCQAAEANTSPCLRGEAGTEKGVQPLTRTWPGKAPCSPHATTLKLTSDGAQGSVVVG